MRKKQYNRWVICAWLMLVLPASALAAKGEPASQPNWVELQAATLHRDAAEPVHGLAVAGGYRLHPHISLLGRVFQAGGHGRDYTALRTGLGFQTRLKWGMDFFANVQLQLVHESAPKNKTDYDVGYIRYAGLRGKVGAAWQWTLGEYSTYLHHSRPGVFGAISWQSPNGPRLGLRAEGDRYATFTALFVRFSY